ncbi:helix-turn-helix transcriptional regulator, partial [Streptomyces rochei]|nr:helix-turn-helix transcriptional regulator [Streptomyces rochei]
AVTLTLRASAAAAHAGDLHRAVSLTRSALAGLGQDADLELAARVRYTLAGNLLRVDNLSAAFAHSSEAFALIPAEPPSPTWVWAAATHVMAARQVGEIETALRVGRRALRVAEELGVADARADLLISVIGLEDDNRTTERGRRQLREARELARRAGNAPVELRALFNLAIGCFESGAPADCLDRAAEGLERARRSGLLSSPYAREMRYLRLLVRYTLGHWEECLREAAEDEAGGPPAAGAHTVAPVLYVALA